jgi:hypothetical protein
VRVRRSRCGGYGPWPALDIEQTVDVLSHSIDSILACWVEELREARIELRDLLQECVVTEEGVNALDMNALALTAQHAGKRYRYKKNEIESVTEQSTTSSRVRQCSQPTSPVVPSPRVE